MATGTVNMVGSGEAAAEPRSPQVVLVGYQAGSYFTGRACLPSFPGDLARQDLPSVAEFVTAAVQSGASVVAIYPKWLEAPTWQRLQTVRAALGTADLVMYGCALPPLAGAVFGALAEALSEEFRSTGSLLAALPQLEEQIVHMAWLSRLSRLREPAPTLRQQARSMLGESAYGVSSFPEPSVRRLTPRQPGVRLPVVSGNARMGLAVSSRGGDEGWLRSVVAPALGHPPIVEVEPTPLGPQWFGSGRFLEAVLCPIDVVATSHAVSNQGSLTVCPGCGHEGPDSRCGFCGLVRAGGPDDQDPG